jgi:hypothetical protein
MNKLQSAMQTYSFEEIDMLPAVRVRVNNKATSVHIKLSNEQEAEQYGVREQYITWGKQTF